MPAKIEVGHIVTCNSAIHFSNGKSHEEGELIEVQPGEEYFFNHVSNRKYYDLDKKNQAALKILYEELKSRDMLKETVYELPGSN